MIMTMVDSYIDIPASTHLNMIAAIRSFVDNRKDTPMEWVDFKFVAGIIDDLIKFALLDSLVLRRMVERVFEEFRWEVKFSANNDIIEINFLGEKEGGDLEFFNIIAPFVESVEECFIELDFEDGSCARWEFTDKQCIEKVGRYERVWS